jgi:hypothetical protein
VSRIAVTGHVHLNGATAAWAMQALEGRLRQEGEAGVRGITCLAEGTDQIFARAVLALSGTLEVVLPARDYRKRVIRAENRTQFEELLCRATAVRTMPFDKSGRDAYLAASEAMLGSCDLLLAIWDGRPSRQPGDTANVVAKACELRLPVEILWPGANEAVDEMGTGEEAE